ncbi:MAG: single-stranded DNA-binding protein [Sphingobacteriales bacterium]|nr:single-stranded DNA-binding protein [Sphingobacteriales bacterium]
MKSNRVTLIGYVGKDLSALKTGKGSKRISIRMATHYPIKNEKGETVWLTTWHDVVAWDNMAEFAERSMVKGSRIIVDGSIEYRTFPDKQGHIRYYTQIKAHSIMNLDR